ncbi:MAG: hypothetical protein R3F20_07220 [Planctomycetota bacterium]
MADDRADVELALATADDRAHDVRPRADARAVAEARAAFDDRMDRLDVGPECRAVLDQSRGWILAVMRPLLLSAVRSLT